MTTSPDETLGRSAALRIDDADGLTAAIDGAPADGAANDLRTVVAKLRRELRVERERSLNATDRVLGAQAEAAQARAEIKELQYLIHVREAELVQANEILTQREHAAGPGRHRGAKDVADRAEKVLRELVGRTRNR